MDKDQQLHYEPPPQMRRPQSFDEKMYDKVNIYKRSLFAEDLGLNESLFVSFPTLQFMKQPLVPIGCAATAYFLASGINSFQKRDPRRAQKMMRARVGAQFATLAIFMYYVGMDNINFDVAPAYYRAKEKEKKSQE